MTKTQEIKLLDKMIKQFGEDSYIGPWLKMLRLSIVYAIENDLPVDLTVRWYCEKYISYPDAWTK